MSEAERGGVGRREVAWRLFAAEFEDADFSYAESDEERAPNYVVTPTGARVNRLFVVGVLTEVERVSDDVLRARVVDPTGAFVVYAGQYQPDALAFLESAETPTFVAVTGKARTFQPEDSEVVYTSVRPESINEVDADTRDRWTVQTAAQTLERVATFADALGRAERGDDLRDALADAGVAPGLAAGIPHAIDHYGTTEAYLAAVRDLAIDAARVVAGETDEVRDLDVEPDAAGPADVDLDVGDVDLGPAAGASGPETGAGGEPPGVEAESEEGKAETEPETEPAEADAEEEAEPLGEPADVEAEGEPAEAESAGAESAEGSLGDFEPAGEGPGAEEPTAGEDEEGAVEATDEMRDLTEEERAEVEENFDVDFSSGEDIPEQGEADIEEPEPESESDADVSDEDEDDADVSDEDEDDEGDTLEDFTEAEYDEPESDAEDDEAARMQMDLEDAVVETMEELDDGDGAPREALVRTVAEDYGADVGEVEGALEDALMSGRCYESGEDHLKAI